MIDEKVLLTQSKKKTVNMVIFWIIIFFLTYFFLHRIMNPKTERVVLTEEGAIRWFEHESLGEGVWGVVVRLQLTNDINEYPSIEHRLAVHGCDQVLDFLEG